MQMQQRMCLAFEEQLDQEKNELHRDMRESLTTRACNPLIKSQGLANTLSAAGQASPIISDPIAVASY
eukprot:12408940-Karenia_brevis.AAC.1